MKYSNFKRFQVSGYVVQISKGVNAQGNIKEFAVRIGKKRKVKKHNNKMHDKKKPMDIYIIFFKIPPNIIFVLILIWNLADFVKRTFRINNKM